MNVAESQVRSPWLPMTRPAVGWLLGVAAVIAGHVYAQALPWDQPTPMVVASHAFACLLLIAMLWLGAALGVRALRALGLGQRLSLETLILSLGLGLGGLAYLVLACGFLGLLQPTALALVFAALAIGLRAELAELAKALPVWGRALLAERRLLQRDWILRLAVPMAELTVLILAVRALAPPIAYDAIVYHLAGPREFLRLGRLAPVPDIQQANMPFTVEMLYLLGLAFGSDELSGLLHLSLAFLSGLAAFSLARRFFGARVGRLTILIFLSAPALAIYGPVANIDYGWAYFDFLAVYAFAAWAHDGRRRWLVVAGLAVGLALGSKYLGALTCAAIALAIVLQAARLGRAEWARIPYSMATFLVPAGLVAAPWYIKNWLWFGSPVWPFLTTDGMLDGGLYFARHMNRGHELLDILLLPLRLYGRDFVDHSWAMPPLLFLLAPGYLAVRKHPLVSGLLAFSALHFVVWSQGIQTLRYLSPIFPAMSVVAAYVVTGMMGSTRFHSLGRMAGSSLTVLSLLIASALGMDMAFRQRPLAQLVGLESREAYLSRNLPDYGAVQYINEHRTDVSRLLVIGEARVFYLEPPILLDQNLDLLQELGGSDPLAAAERLRQSGISHVLLAENLVVWHTDWDPELRVKRAWAGFERTRPAYLSVEYKDEAATIYRVAHAAVERSDP